MTTIDKILIFLIALFFVVGAFAEVVCDRLPDGSWNCYNNGGGGQSTVVTNYLGSCSNCVQMTEAECLEVKTQITNTTERLIEYLNIEGARVNAIKIGLDRDIEEINSFGQVTGNQSVDYMQNYYTQAQYCRDPRGGENVGGWSGTDVYNRNYYAVCINSLYEYGQSLINGPSNLVFMQEDMASVATALTNYVTLAGNVNHYASQIVCDSCGGGGEGGIGESCSAGCPCEEQLEAIKSFVDDIFTEARKIEPYLITITNYTSQIKKDLHDIADESIFITNFIHRLDDYVFDEYTNEVYKIYHHVNWLGDLMSADYNDITSNFWGVISSWKMANTMSKYHFDDSPAVEATDKYNFIDYGKQIFNNSSVSTNGNQFSEYEYGNLNWFQRIEFLLGNIGGLFNNNDTNIVNNSVNDFTSQQKQQLDEAQSTLDAIEDEFTSPQELIEGWITSYKNAKTNLNPFKELKNIGSLGNITFLPEQELEISDNMTINIPEIYLDLSGDSLEMGGAVAYTANMLFNFLWWVIGFISVGLLLFWFVKQLFKILHFYHKVQEAWSHTLYNIN